MYGKDDPDTFQVLTTSSDSSFSNFVFADEDAAAVARSVTKLVFEHRVTSESPTPITQLCVRLQFRLVKMYPMEPPLIGCRSIIGASRQQCLDLLVYLKVLAREKTGQIMLFDLILAAGDWLNARVAEGHQGSLHDSMLETERLRILEVERKVQEKQIVTEEARRVESSIAGLTAEQEGELRRKWLKSNSGSMPPRSMDGGNVLSGNLSYTMSRFMRAQGSNPFRGAGKSSTTTSLVQTVHLLQNALVQQQTLVSHLLAQWLTMSRTLTGNDWSDSLLDYLESEGLLDERQAELVKFPGRIPVSSLFPNATGSSPATGFISTPAERLSQRLHPQAERSDDSVSVTADHTHTAKSRYEQDFEQLEYLGSGAFGDVWKVRNRLDGIYYAVKRVRICKVRETESAEQVVASNKDVNRILREVTTLGRIQSPYVLRYHQAWIEESTEKSLPTRRLRAKYDNTLRSSSFFEDHHLQSSEDAFRENMESVNLSGGQRQLSLCIQTAYCPKTLSDFLASDGAGASMAELWRLCRMMLEGLAHIHAHGIMHRDMKPSNIFIDSNGDIRIGDFGLATFEGRNDAPRDESETASENIEHSRHIGTKLYASPEQEGEEDGEYDERTDVYSLGIIFFELWHPFRTSYERVEQLTKLKEGIVPGKFAESHPRQWKLITAMIKRSVQDRPTATSILQSDLLPPRMEDDFLNDALRVVANPNTPVFPRILEKLFSPSKQSVHSKPPPKLFVNQSLSQYFGLLPEAVVLEQRKEWVTEVFRRTFERHGAVRVPSPIFSTINPESSIREDEVTLMDHNGALLGLRYDSRSFFIRTITEAYVNSHSALMPDVLFKRYDIASAFRKPNRLGLHPVQIVRADFDVVGVDPLSAEAECLCVSSEILETFQKDIQWVRIRLNHVELYSFILEQADIEVNHRSAILRALLDSSNMTSTCARTERWDSIRKALASSSAPISDKQINIIGRWFRTSTGSVAEALAAVKDQVDEEDRPRLKAVTALGELMILVDHALGSEFREKEFMLDLCSPAPSDDYDGIYFRVDVAFTANPDVGDVVVLGGRYDAALRKYPESSSGQMVGISCNVSKLISYTNAPPAGILSSPDVLVCAIYDSKLEEDFAANMKREQLSLAAEFWRSNISADVFYGANSWQEQLEFAINRGVRYIVLLREKDLPTIDSEERRGDLDFNVYLRVLTGSKGKHAREQPIKRSEIVNYLSHRSDR